MATPLTAALGRDPPLPVADDRTSAEVCRAGPTGPYRPVVNDPIIDTAAWATFVREQLAVRGLTPETAAHPLGPIPAGVATIRRWRDNTGQVVKLDSVFAVAKALGYPLPRLLVRLGLLELDDLGIGGVAPPQQAGAHHPITRRIDAILDNKRLPSWAKDWLVDLLDGVVTSWGKNVPNVAQQQPGRTPRKAT